jgi:predicted MFS family arabinose efflux permease
LPLILLPHWAGVGLGFIGMVALASLTTPVFAVFSQETVAPRWRNVISSVLAMTMGVSIAGVGFGGGHLIMALGHRALFLVAAGLTLASAFIFLTCFSPARREVASLPVEATS